MKVLGIETSCDECAAAVVEDGQKILSNRVATQIDWHRQYNGVVPEIASRIHTEWIRPVVREALQEAGLKKEDIDAVAVTNRPGLIGSLLVGVSFAKSFAYALGLPFVGVDHIRAHIYAAHLEREIPYPYIGLLVSGGNTILCEVRDFDDIVIRGTTIDDAVGEAFDKVAKFYGFGYPGGVAVDRLAGKGDAGVNGGPNGDLILVVQVGTSQIFQRKGADIYTSVDVSLADALLGASVTVKTVKGEFDLSVPSCTQPNTVLKMAGMGVTLPSGKTGNQYVTINVVFPKSLNSEEKDLIRQFDEAEGRKPQGVFSWLRNKFKGN